MKLRSVLVVAGVSLAVVLGSHISNDNWQQERRSVGSGAGNAQALEASYDTWAASYTRRGGDQRLVLSLSYSKGLSAEITKAYGQAEFDLKDQLVSVSVSGLSEQDTYDVWLIDNRPGPGSSVKPEPGDAMVRLGSLRHGPDGATLRTGLAEAILPGFEIDLVTITRGGEDPGQGGLLIGSPSLFQKIYYNRPDGEFAALGDAATPNHSGPGQPDPWTIAFSAFIPSPASAQVIGDPAFDPLVIQGRDLFLNETFNGNGRTCGTCHREDNNFTIDPTFIANLPADDPLFVAEFIPALSENFENPVLMREFGLILANTNGFGDLANNFTMRGVPHTLALSTSVDDRGTPRTGWSGDGAPGGGTLREFAIGAVTQHAPLTLARVAGVDFRLPTDAELDAMEAFQLSLGRPADIDVGPLNLQLTSVVASRGQEIFFDDNLSNCNRCHFNAGANDSIGGNRNHPTGVEDLPDQPARLTAELIPLDDGFGSPGNGAFNTPPLIEAADTGPFFHNNSINSIEMAVAFYNGAAFNNSPSAIALGQINMDATQVVAVAAFLRLINALENIDSAITFAERAIALDPSPVEQIDLLRLASAENSDAIEVLRGGGLHPDAVQFLEVAERQLRRAIRAIERARTNRLLRTIDRAILEQLDARSLMVVE